MPIFKRNNIWYIDITTASGRRIKQSARTTDKQEAQKLHDKLKHELWRIEQLGEKPNKSWDEAALRWIQEKQHQKKSIHSDIGRLRGLPELRGILLKHMSRDVIMGIIGQKDCSNSTKNRYIALIRAILNRACHEWNWLDSVPKLSLYREPKRRIRWLTSEEAERLLQALPEHLADMAAFSLATGLRQSNVFQLQWSQVDLTRSVAWIHANESKSNRAIGVALNQTAINTIKKQLGRHHQFVFTNPNGKPIKSLNTQAWKKALTQAGISNFRWHDLRHTWASWLVQSGVPLAVLQEMGGWESVSMVQRYAHLAPEHLKGHAEQLDKILSPNFVSLLPDLNDFTN